MKRFLVILVLIASISAVYAANNYGYGIKLSKNENNLLIENIIPNSEAEKTGLKVGQKIIKFNGKKIEKIKMSDIENLDNSYKNIKLIMDDKKEYNLKPENVDLLNLYNDIQNTYNTNTAYSINPYSTDKILLPNNIDSKHVKYTNAYFNYADIISNENAKLFVELFKVTKKNLIKSYIYAQDNPKNEYAQLYKSIYSVNPKQYDIYGNAFKDFLRLAIYNEQNKEVIDRQISEFNSTQKKQYAQLVYNTRIIANLYSYANRELGLYLIKHSINVNQTDKWKNELKTQNTTYNKMYNELCQSLSKNKIEINKPGPLSNREQMTAGVTPKEKWVDDKQIILLAQEKGYDPNKIPEIKKINEAKIAAQKQKKDSVSTKNMLPLTSKKISKNNVEFFGGLNPDSSIVEVINTFKNINSVTKITSSYLKCTGPYNQYCTYSGKIDFKNIPTDSTHVLNTIGTMLASRPKTSIDLGNSIGSMPKDDITLHISTIYIESIPFNVEVTLRPSKGYYFYNQPNILKGASGTGYPYAINTIVLKTDKYNKAVNDLVLANGQKIVNAYRYKYNLSPNNSCYEGDECNNFVAIRYYLQTWGQPSMEITYKNYSYLDNLDKQYNQYVTTKTIQRNQKYNSINKI